MSALPDVPVPCPHERGASGSYRRSAEAGRWAALAAAVLGTALAYMSDDMLNLAIPSVARDLHASAPAVQWILNAYYRPGSWAARRARARGLKPLSVRGNAA
jgi:hypothetical protein